WLIGLLIACAAAQAAMSMSDSSTEHVASATTPDLAAAEPQPIIRTPRIPEKAPEKIAEKTAEKTPERIAEKAVEQMAENAAPVQVALQSSGGWSETPAQTVDTTSTQSESGWRRYHLTNRHYVSISSNTEESELKFLCMPNVRCGWFVNLHEEASCDKTSKGKQHRVRLETQHVVREYVSRCSGYGLFFLDQNKSDTQSIYQMVTGNRQLTVSSSGMQKAFSPQRFDTYGASVALKETTLSAGL
ncbi:MAG: hypothetical protein KTR32_36730, partial [Granulosicoccus sp.]|nr:hypothetical protein [Granulosicoccus sp.]